MHFFGKKLYSIDNSIFFYTLHSPSKFSFKPAKWICFFLLQFRILAFKHLKTILYITIHLTLLFEKFKAILYIKVRFIL